jgi:phasin family protein
MEEAMAEQSKFGGMPSFDFGKLMESFRLPGLDVSALLERERKNIEALAEASRIVFEGWQALIQRQADIMKEAMEEAISSARLEDTKNRVDMTRQAFEKALSNMRELAEMATKSQRDAFEVVRKRWEEDVSAFRAPKSE